MRSKNSYQAGVKGACGTAVALVDGSMSDWRLAQFRNRQSGANRTVNAPANGFYRIDTAGDVTLSAVPEPATAVTAAFGFAVVGGVAMSRWRHRRGGCRF